MAESAPQNTEQGTEVEASCVGCPFSERNVLQSIALMIRKGPRYKKEDCPGAFVGIVKTFSVMDYPRSAAVVACPSQETWEDVEARYLGYPQQTVYIHEGPNEKPWTIGMDSVELAFENHINVEQR